MAKNINQNVKKDDLIFTISPKNNPYYLAKLKTPKTNSGKIKIGQQVNVKLNDYPDYEFGVLRGKVQRISNVSNSNGTYIVDVRISNNLKTSFSRLVP